MILRFTKTVVFATMFGIRGSNSGGRVSAFQAECRGFEPRLPLIYVYIKVAVRRGRPLTVINASGHWPSA